MRLGGTGCHWEPLSDDGCCGVLLIDAVFHWMLMIAAKRFKKTQKTQKSDRFVSVRVWVSSVTSQFRMLTVVLTRLFDGFSRGLKY